VDKKEELDLVRKKIEVELDCPLKKSATNLVFAKGNCDAKVFIIGEAPGKNEDLQGVPFVGKAGQNLNEYLKIAGLDLDVVYIANILKYRPPQNRNPTNEEIAKHTPYLIEQIKIVKPKILITLGNFSSKFVLGKFSVEGMDSVEGITKIHGKRHEVDFFGQKIIVYPIYHPAAVIYNRKLVEQIKQDFVKLSDILKCE